MKAFIIYLLLLGLLLGIMLPLSFAQQNQTTPVSDPEVEILKERILELQNQLQTVKNEELEIVAKLLDAQAKLADANAKLANVEFGKFERELRDSNDEWLWTWIQRFVGTISVFVLIIGGAFWFWVKSLIADRVEKSLPGFKDAMDQVDLLKNQLRILRKEHAVSVLESFINVYYDSSYPQSIEALHDETLLQVFSDEECRPPIRDKAVEVLDARKSPQLVSLALKFLNSGVDSDFNQETFTDTTRLAHRLIYFLGGICTDEVYQGLEKFLNRLLNESLKHKDLFLTKTVFSLANVSVQLNIKDSTPILKSAVSHLQDPDHNLSVLAEYFDKFNEPESIKEILTNGLTDEMPDVETQCLELLQKHDPDFVENWKARKAAANTETEESA